MSVDERVPFGEAMDIIRKSGNFWTLNLHRPAEKAWQMQIGMAVNKPNGNICRLPFPLVLVAELVHPLQAKGGGEFKGKRNSRALSGVPSDFHGDVLSEPPSQSYPWGRKVCFGFQLKCNCDCNGQRSHFCPNPCHMEDIVSVGIARNRARTIRRQRRASTSPPLSLKSLVLRVASPAMGSFRVTGFIVDRRCMMC